jgi:hypothetical protein
MRLSDKPSSSKVSESGQVRPIADRLEMALWRIVFDFPKTYFFRKLSCPAFLPSQCKHHGNIILKKDFQAKRLRPS